MDAPYISRDDLNNYVCDAHNSFRKQVPNPYNENGNCTTFAATVATYVAARYFPETNTPEKPLWGMVPHIIYTPRHLQRRILRPDERITTSLGIPQAVFSTLDELVAHCEHQRVPVGIVGAVGHAFNIVRTDEGYLIADAQHGFVCTPDQWEGELLRTSGKTDRTKTPFRLQDMRDHDPMFPTYRALFEGDMRKLLYHPEILKILHDIYSQALRNPIELAGPLQIRFALTDPGALSRIRHFDDFGQLFIEGNRCGVLLDAHTALRPGEWVIGRKHEGLIPYIVLGTERGTLSIDPIAAQITDEPADPMMVFAASHTFDARHITTMVEMPWSLRDNPRLLPSLRGNVSDELPF